MKKFNLSLVTVLAMSTFAIAGGDIAPVEPMVETPYVEEAQAGGFYMGLGYGYQNLTLDNTLNGNKALDADFGSIMIDAGYKFNSYIAVEGRYWFGLSSSQGLSWKNDLNSDITVDTWGLYVKPMYPVSPAMNVYALLGYGSTDVTYDIPNGGSLTSDSTDGFSWGIGADYAFSDNWSVFVDYTEAINDETVSVGGTRFDTSVGMVNFGVNYTF